jgi:nucleoside permease NupC
MEYGCLFMSSLLFIPSYFNHPVAFYFISTEMGHLKSDTPTFFVGVQKIIDSTNAGIQFLFGGLLNAENVGFTLPSKFYALSFSLPN